DRNRLAPLGTLHVAAVLHGHGVVEADDAIFLDLHGWARILRMGAHYPGKGHGVPNPLRSAGALACVVALAALLAGCGGGGDRVRNMVPPPRAWHDSVATD